MAAPKISAEDCFAGHPGPVRICEAVQGLVSGFGPCSTRATKSQMSFRRGVGFALLWLPGRWLRDPASEVVLSIALRRLDPSPRFKQVAHPAARVWMHHLEVHSVADLDDEVRGWLCEAYQGAG
jgi:hypothetical protein